MKIPRIHIDHGSLLDINRARLAESKGDTYPEYIDVFKYTNKAIGWWQDINKDNYVLEKIYELTGIELDYIEVWIIGGKLGSSMSKPLILQAIERNGEWVNEDSFKIMIIHELIHRYIGDARKNPIVKRYWSVAREEFQGEPEKTQNHILLYAILIKVLSGIYSIDVIQKYDIFTPEYQRAFDIALERGDELIEKFRSLVHKTE